MVFKFPLEDVVITVTEEKKRIAIPVYSDEWNEINQHEFTLDVEDVGWFYVSDGKNININLYDGYSFAAAELFLNSSIYAAILHQRKILALHASCFGYRGKNVMICGHSGAGKSSITVGFCLTGSTFITDDVSPVVFNSEHPAILSLSDRIKLWDDSLDQLKIVKEGLGRIQEEVEKFYYPIDTGPAALFPLHHLFLLEVVENINQVIFEEVKGAEKLELLHAQVYKPEILLGMPQNNMIYFPRLTAICNAVKLTKISRPVHVPIGQMIQNIKAFLD